MGAKMNWYLTVLLKKYAMFSGRARRKEYWYFHLVDLIMVLVFVALSITLDVNINFIIIPYALITLIPRYAVLSRRLHDIGKSAWWLLFPLIPLSILLVSLGSLFVLMPNNSLLNNNINPPVVSAPAMQSSQTPASTTNPLLNQASSTASTPNPNSNKSRNDVMAQSARTLARLLRDDNAMQEMVQDNIALILIIIFGVILYPFYQVFCSTMVFAFTVVEGQIGTNKFGANPKG